jgi:hypothetical protein
MIIKFYHPSQPKYSIPLKLNIKISIGTTIKILYEIKAALAPNVEIVPLNNKKYL